MINVVLEIKIALIIYW